jgi:tripartite-type tricarboxylate transporter receptor subunit TctC
MADHTNRYWTELTKQRRLLLYWLRAETLDWGRSTAMEEAMKRTICSVMSLAALLLMTAGGRADPIEDFYRGKTMQMVIGYGAGGGYDLYGRLAAEFLTKHIPGHPTIVPQNMPGAGSFRAAKYLNEAAPHDGTVLASLSQTLATDTAAGSVTGLDATKFRYIGRITTNIDMGVALPRSGIKSFAEVRKREVTVGVTGGASTAVLLPTSLNKYAGAKFKLVRGYKGSAEILLAAERGEVEVIGATGLPNALVRKPGWINKGEVTILYQAALKRHRLLPNTPALPELGLTDEGKAVLRVIASTAEVGRSIVTTPGVPAERVAALRKAFQDMLKDPDFVATCKQRHLMVDPASGEEIDAHVKETVSLPKSIVSQVGALAKSK